MPAPAVSVIIGAYNSMPYLTRCVNSVLEQSIGLQNIEIITINDGSTDNTGAELDRFAAEHPLVVRVVHQENSGGPAKPRNVGLGMATGRYIFFLDADDYLGPEALERMVHMAEENGSDVVLGKMVGVGGRGTPNSMFTHDQASADIFSSRVYWTLNPMRLFRRELIEAHGLRFRTDMKTGEDQPFVGLAYILATKVSVLASYDCVYWVNRDDGGNTTKSTSGAAPRVLILTTMLPLVAAHVEAGPKRDHLFHRHLQYEFTRAVRRVGMESDPRVRNQLFTDLQQVITTWHSEGAVERLFAIVRLQYELVRRGLFSEVMTVLSYMKERAESLGQARAVPGQRMVPEDLIVEGHRIYAGYPFFRDSAAGIPDTVYDITEEVKLSTFVRVKSLAAEWDSADAKMLVLKGKSTSASSCVSLQFTASDQESGRTVTAPIQSDAGDSRSFRTPISLGRTGSWQVSLEIIGVPGWRQPLPRMPSLKATRWTRFGMPRYATQEPRASHLHVRVGRIRILQGILRRLKG